MSSDIILGAIIGAIATGIIQLGLKIYERLQEASSLRAALLGEVSAILEIVKVLKVEEYLSEIQKSFGEQTGKDRIYLTVKEDYFLVYKANINRLGLLNSKLAEDISTFYTFCFSGMEHLNELSNQDWMGRIEKEEGHRKLENLFSLLFKIREKGNNILSVYEGPTHTDSSQKD